MLGILITVVVTVFAVSMSVFILLFLLSWHSDEVNKRKSLRSAPYHESGHAIIAMTTGMGFHEVSIQENPENYGHMSYRETNYRTDRNSVEGNILSLSPREELENRIMVAMAGYVAETIYCGLENFPTKPVFNSDVQVIDELIRANPFLYADQGISISVYYSTMLDRTKKILENEASSHLKLVEALKNYQVINECEAWNLVRHELINFPMDPYLEADSVSSF